MKNLIVTLTLFALSAFLCPTRAFSQGKVCNLGGVCSGSITANAQAVILPVAQDTATIVVTVEGTGTGTLQFKGSGDSGASYFSASGTPQPSGSGATSTTANGQWRFVASGYTSFEVVASSSMTGSATVTITASKGSAASGGRSGGATNPGSPLNSIQINNNNSFDGTVGIGFSKTAVVINQASGVPYLFSGNPPLPAGTYDFKIAITDGTNYSNIATWTGGCVSPANTGCEIDYDPTTTPLTPSDTVEGWVSFNGGAYQHLVSGNGYAYLYNGTPSVYIDGAATYDSVPIPGTVGNLYGGTFSGNFLLDGSAAPGTLIQAKNKNAGGYPVIQAIGTDASSQACVRSDAGVTSIAMCANSTYVQPTFSLLDRFTPETFFRFSPESRKVRS
jgi:hypothetical protein